MHTQNEPRARKRTQPACVGMHVIVLLVARETPAFHTEKGDQRAAPVELCSIGSSEEFYSKEKGQKAIERECVCVYLPGSYFNIYLLHKC